VSGKCRDIITTDANIRRALFFEPLTTPTDEHIAVADAKAAQIYKDSIEQPTFAPYYETLPAGLPASMPINPLLHRFLHHSSQKVSGHPYGNSIGLVADRSYVSAPLVDLLDGSYESASWRKMFVLQPHAAHAYLMSGSRIEFSLMHGITMTDMEKLRENEGSSRIALHSGVVFVVKGKDARDSLCYGLARALSEVCGRDILAKADPAFVPKMWWN